MQEAVSLSELCARNPDTVEGFFVYISENHFWDKAAMEKCPPDKELVLQRSGVTIPILFDSGQIEAELCANRFTGRLIAIRNGRVVFDSFPATREATEAGQGWVERLAEQLHLS